MNDPQSSRAFDRRTMLKTLALTAGGLASARPLRALEASEQDTFRGKVIAYLEKHARAEDGGYAWADQEQSHLSPTFAVIGCYHLLGAQPPAPGRLGAFIRAHHPFVLKKGEREIRRFDFEQIQALRWLGDEAADFRDRVRTWKAPTLFTERYETHRFPIFQNEVTAFTCRELLGLPLDDLAPAYIGYLDERRRANGSFHNTPAADGSDGHVMNTWWGVQALRALGRTGERQQETIAWLRACQGAAGGFRSAPRPVVGTAESAVNTWAGVRALHALGSVPEHREACVEYLASLGNADGGFGDQPGWLSNPLASYYALDALAALGALDTPRKPPARRPTERLPEGLQVFTAQIEAHGKGSPTEAVALAGALHIHLWGAKNADPRWLARAQAVANERGVPVKFFVANEEYGTLVRAPGFGTYSHTSDIIAPAGAEIGRSLANAGEVTWEEFRERRLAPLQKAGGRLVWQFGENEELTRAYFDDSLQRGGYAAISTFHFGNPDFTNISPYLRAYRGQIPFIALQDAHGDEPWWFADMTTGFRTLFLATAPTWEGWLEALRRNWVAAVRHDAASGQRTWMHSGSDEVRDFVREHESAWRWWDNPAIQRPLVSLVAVRPEDEFEAARPERGIMLRVRCQCENTTQGQPKKPLVELVSLAVDGGPVNAIPNIKSNPSVPLHDIFYQHHLPEPGAGKHIATATVRRIADDQAGAREKVVTLEFTAGGG